MSVWRSPEVEQKAMDVFHEPTIGFYFVSAVGIALSLPPASFYSALAAFHTFLIYKGQTTYDYLIERSKKQRLKREATAKAKLSQTKSSPSNPQPANTFVSKVVSPPGERNGEISNDIKQQPEQDEERVVHNDLNDESKQEDSRPLLESRDTEVNVV